jgi:hypothetical protein
MWRTLRHPNVLPLIGVMMSESQFAMISDWMADGNICDYVKKYPSVNRIELVGVASETPPPWFVDGRKSSRWKGSRRG